MTTPKVLVMVSVHSAVPWPNEILKVSYEGCDLQLVPPKLKKSGEFYDTYPLVAADGVDKREATEKIQTVHRFLNALAWREQSSIREVGLEVTSWATVQAVQVLGNSTTEEFSTANLSIPSSREARLALAFYRDGLSVQHTGFQVLSFFKIFNILHAAAKPQIEWMNARLSDVRGGHARARIDELIALGEDVGSYLYYSGRCAVAHAFAQPLLDPDNIEDERRLRSDLPAIRELSAILMQREWNVSPPRVAV